AMRTGPGAETPLVWHSPKDAPFRIAGFAWWETDRAYRRMPVAPPEPLPEAVDKLADWTAGGQIRFRSDSKRVAVRVTLTDKADMNHMPATGQCGFDCYIGSVGEQRFVGVTKYDHHQVGYEHKLYEVAEPVMRSFTLNFPLYMGVREVHVGLEADAEVLAPDPYESDGRVIVYGTSITQGGCAARPGMCYTNILSRRIHREFINLGFSGSGRGEPEVARTVATIARPALFVLDYEGNAGGIEPLTRTFPEFIRILREAHPSVPILALSHIRFAGESVNPKALAARLERRDFQKKIIDDLRAAGDVNVHFLDGSDVLGEDFDECTVDGVHPTDLGFLRIADAVTPVIRGILETT
ncbi:MAG TPA: SGNH/GDSL hydrolase family protein, partial [Planctomycetota bacterium]|nr:SGNH/GDSL hydrolase family protein [Planctomycetota bacterium]